MVRPRRQLVPVIVASLLGPACHRDEADRVAELADAQRSVEANGHADPDTWTPAKVGHGFGVGDAVRTGEESSARVRLLPAGGLVLGANSQVRFGRGEQRVGLEVGEAEIESGEEGFVVTTDIGKATVDPSSRVSVSVRDGTLRFQVLVGAATIEESSGEQKELAAGDTASLTAANRQPPAPVKQDSPPASEADAAPPPGVRVTVRGSGARARGPTDGDWRDLHAGRGAVAPGTRVRLDRHTGIVLARRDGRATIHGAADFVVGGDGEPIARATRGSATLAAGHGDVVLTVPGGAIIARRRGHSRAQVQVGPHKRSVVTAERGVVAIRAGDREKSLPAGERASLSSKGRIQVMSKAPRRADFTIPAGESAVVHAPRPPVAVRVRFARACPGAGVVELAADRSFDSPEMVSRGAGNAIVRVPGGTRYYRVRCVAGGEPGDTAARGRLRVRRDPGSAPLAKKPAHTTLDADGRRYTVLYQNLLPALTFHWQRPAASDLDLHVLRRGGKEKVVSAPQARVDVSSGTLKEGHYAWWFQSRKTPAIRSPRTRLVVRFDNAASTAYVRRPAVGARWKRSHVRVSGSTIRGWKVSVGGKPIPTDEQRRFEGVAAVPQGDRALAIRFAHPSRGVHYYLRRSGGR
jgi:hypothetical protein